MVKLHLTHVSRVDRVSAAKNKPYVSISIKATEYGNKFLSGFGNKDNANWKEGDEVEILEVKEVVKDGKTYLNFEMPKAQGAGNGEVLAKLSAMSLSLDQISPKLDQVLREFDTLKPYLIEALKLVKIADKPTSTVYPMPADEGLPEKGMGNFDPQS